MAPSDTSVPSSPKRHVSADAVLGDPAARIAALGSGTVTGIGSLPHRNEDVAAEFSLNEIDLPVMPRLPRRSPAEGLVGQALVGLNGVRLGQYGAVSIDLGVIDPAAPVVTDLSHDAFTGFRAFLDAATNAGYQGPVKWQFVGPVSLGVALQRAGLPTEIAFDVAVNAVRAHIIHLRRAISAALPHSAQVMFLDEPEFGAVFDPDFAIAPDMAIDFASMALSAVEGQVVTGLHSCHAHDLSLLLAVGPNIVSLPCADGLADSAGYLARFLDDDGLVAWGAVTATGPLAVSAESPWRRLTALWCELVQVGVDPARLRLQALISPSHGLAALAPGIAERMHRIAADVGAKVRDQALATKFSLGA
jgi:hypothetical protein